MNVAPFFDNQTPMKHYRKRNIHHPILLLDGQPIPWQRVGHTGVLAVDESVPESKGLIEYLDKVAAESPGSVQVITADVYAAQVEAEKKTRNPQQGRTFVNRKTAAVDSARSAKPVAPSPRPSSGSEAAAAAVEKAGPKPPKKRAIISPPVIATPPGIGNIDEP